MSTPEMPFPDLIDLHGLGYIPVSVNIWCLVVFLSVDPEKSQCGFSSWSLSEGAGSIRCLYDREVNRSVIEKGWSAGRLGFLLMPTRFKPRALLKCQPLEVTLGA